MSNRHSDEESVAYDATDQLLDRILTDTDADLHAALSNVINLDAGLAVIVGSYGFERPVIHARPIVEPDVAKGSRGVHFLRRWRLRSCGGLVRALLFGLTSFQLWLPFKRSHVAISTKTGRSPHRQSLAAVFDQVNALVDLLSTLNRFITGSKRRRGVQSCAVLLIHLREKLDDGNISRDEAKEIITRAQRTLRTASTQYRQTKLTAYSIISATATAAVSLVSMHSHYLPWAFVAFTFACVLLSILPFLEPKRWELSKIDSKLTSLRRTVDRLFDDADDRDRDWSNLPC